MRLARSPIRAKNVTDAAVTKKTHTIVILSGAKDHFECSPILRFAQHDKTNGSALRSALGIKHAPSNRTSSVRIACPCRESPFIASDPQLFVGDVPFALRSSMDSGGVRRRTLHSAQTLRWNVVQLSENRWHQRLKMLDSVADSLHDKNGNG